MVRQLLTVALLCLASFASAQTWTIDANLDNSSTDLSTCVEPSCNPGGNPVGPTSVGNQVVTTTPCGAPFDGQAMKFFVTGPAYVNALWSYKTGPMTNATHFTMKWSVCFDANISTAQAFEADIANFVAGTPGTNYMFGGQCDFSRSVYSVWDQSNPRWIPTTIPCPASQFADGAWHTFERNVHTDPNKALWFDELKIDGTLYYENVMGQYSAGTLHTGWSSTRIWQLQLDIGSSGTPLTMWVDKLNGIAWQ